MTDDTNEPDEVEGILAALALNRTGAPFLPPARHVQKGEEVGRGMSCRHEAGLDVDPDARSLTCRKCGGEVDPIATIVKWADGWKRIADDERYARNRVRDVEGELAKANAALRKLKAAIATEQERAAKVGLAVEGSKRARQWRRSADRIITVGQVLAGIDLVEKHGGAVRVNDASGVAIAFIVCPTLRFVPR